LAEATQVRYTSGKRAGACARLLWQDFGSPLSFKRLAAQCGPPSSVTGMLFD